MDIKKCKVEKNREWPAAVVKGLAVTLGMSALVSLEGCASKTAKTNDNLPKSSSPSSSLSEKSSSSMSSSSMSSSSNSNSTISSSSSEVPSNDQNKLFEIQGDLDGVFDSVNIDSIDFREYLDNSLRDGGVIEMYNGEN